MSCIKIIHAKEKTPFEIVKRAVIRDERLTFEARGLFIFLDSLPQNWQLYKDHLIKMGPTGREKLNRIIKELARFGAIKISPNRLTAADAKIINDEPNRKEKKQLKAGVLWGHKWEIFPADLWAVEASLAPKKISPDAVPAPDSTENVKPVVRETRRAGFPHDGEPTTKALQKQALTNRSTTTPPSTPGGQGDSSNFDDVKKENPSACQGVGGVEFNIPKNLKRFCGEIITATAGLDLKTCQELVNQMSSGLQDGEIHSPGAWLKKMATLARKGDFNFVESQLPKQKTESVGEYVEKIKQDQAAKAAEDARLKASRQSNREALDCLKSLEPAAREGVEREFALHLSKTNTLAASFFNRSGFQNPLVISEFKKYREMPALA